MRSGLRSALPVLLAALIPAFLTGLAYWPGLMGWDPVHQYGQALSGQITDWHPPIMQWLWEQFIPVWSGPAPMLLIQLVTWWGGLALLAVRALSEARRGLGWGLLACGLLPLGLALSGAVFKDSMMAGALVSAAGLIAWRDRRRLTVPLAVVLLVFASALRFNGFVAAMPLLLMLLPEAFRRTWPRLVLSAMLASAALVAVVPAINAVIGAKPSGVQLSLLIYDIGGITEFSGVNAFPSQLRRDLDDNPIVDPVGVNHRCYDPEKWDSYSDWVDPECPLGFTDWNAELVPAGIDAKRVWLAAVLHHPFAYAEHRLTHFAWNTRIFPMPDAVERPVPVETVENDWGFHITAGPVWRAIDGLAMASAHTPLGWPIVMIALAFGAVVVASSANRPLPFGAAIRGGNSPDRTLLESESPPPSSSSSKEQGLTRLALPLALSAFLYGFSYLPLSVASELRYHLWTSLSALLATVLALANARGIGRRRLVLAYAPALVAVVVCLAFRM